jgi:hypothetical protein
VFLLKSKLDRGVLGWAGPSAQCTGPVHVPLRPPNRRTGESRGGGAELRRCLPATQARGGLGEGWSGSAARRRSGPYPWRRRRWTDAASRRSPADGSYGSPAIRRVRRGLAERRGRGASPEFTEHNGGGGRGWGRLERGGGREGRAEVLRRCSGPEASGARLSLPGRARGRVEAGEELSGGLGALNSPGDERPCHKPPWESSLESRRAGHRANPWPGSEVTQARRGQRDSSGALNG